MNVVNILVIVFWIKFIGASKVGDEITGFTKILKKTNTLIFLFCELRCNDKIITSASGIWKILKVKPSNLGPGGWLLFSSIIQVAKN